MAKDASLDAAVVEFCEKNDFEIEQGEHTIISKNNIAICTVDSSRQVAPAVVKNQDKISGYFDLMKVLKKNNYEILVGKD